MTETHVPFGWLITRPRNEEEKYLSEFTSLPKSVRELISTARTASFITGLAKSYDLLNESAAVISLILVRLAFGENNLSQLPAILSTELKIPNDKAQKLANEIEKELLAPIALDLNRYTSQKKQGQQSMAGKLISSQNPGQNGPSNVLNLKNQPKAPLPPPIPR